MGRAKEDLIKLTEDVLIELDLSDDDAFYEVGDFIMGMWDPQLTKK